MKYVPYSPCPGRPKGMLSRRMSCSVPSASTIVASDLCDLRGASSSSISILSIFVRPMISSWRGVGVPDQRRCGQIQAGRIGRAVDKAEKVTCIEISKAGNFVDDGHAVAKVVEQN